jgi:hypothetical protein
MVVKGRQMFSFGLQTSGDVTTQGSAILPRGPAERCTDFTGFKADKSGEITPRNRYISSPGANGNMKW